MKTGLFYRRPIVGFLVVLGLLSQTCSLPQFLFRYSEITQAYKKPTCSGCSKPIAGAKIHQPGETYSIGDLVDANGVYIALLGWSLPAQVDVMIINWSSAYIPVYTLTQMHLRDQDGTEYPVTSFTSLAQSADFEKKVRPGDWVHGQVGFIPSLGGDAKGLQFVFDLDGTAKSEVVFDLGNEPGQLGVPDAVRDALFGQKAGVGEEFLVGDLEVVVKNVRSPSGRVANPLPGNRYIVFDLEVTNRGRDTVEFLTVSSLSLVGGSDWTKYAESFLPLGTVNGSPPDILKLRPGDTTKGQVGFEVSAQEKSLFLAVLDPKDASQRAYVTIE